MEWHFLVEVVVVELLSPSLDQVVDGGGGRVSGAATEAERAGVEHGDEVWGR